MSGRDLARLVAARTEALARERRKQPWCDLSPAARAVEEQTLRDVATAEAAIMAVLLASPGPVRANGVILHLTADRMHFVELDPQTGDLIWIGPSYRGQKGYKAMLYKYPHNGVSRNGH